MEKVQLLATIQLASECEESVEIVELFQVRIHKPLYRVDTI